MKKALKGLIALAFWIIVWYIGAAALGKPLLLPYPHSVVLRLIELIPTAGFLSAVGGSLLRVISGLAGGIIIGAAAALLTHRFKTADLLLSPFLSVIQATPVASFIILLLLWMGRDILPAVISALIVIPVVWRNVSEGLGQTDKNILEMALIYHIRGYKKFRFITVPYVLPYLKAAVRSAVGMGWKAGVAAEVLAVSANSIGRNIYESKLYLETTDLFAWTVLVIVLSVIIEKLVSAIFKGKGAKNDAQDK